MIPARRSATAPSWATSSSLNVRGCSVWTLRTPTIWSCQVSGTDSIEATKRRWSMPRTHRNRGVGLDVGDDQRLAVGGDPAGDALAERHARPADLEAVEAVGRGQGQVRSVAVEEVQRGDIGVEDIAGPVDDGLEQLVPRPGRRRQAGDLVEEAQLLELVGRRPAAAGAAGPRRGGRAGRRCRTRTGRSSRASRYKPTEWLRPGKVAMRWRLGRGTVQPDAAAATHERRGRARERASRAVAAEPLGIGTAGRARPAGRRGPAARRAARPGHHRAGRPGAVRPGRADPAPDDRAAPRRRPGRTRAARRGAARPRSRRMPRP